MQEIVLTEGETFDAGSSKYQLRLDSINQSSNSCVLIITGPGESRTNAVAKGEFFPMPYTGTRGLYIKDIQPAGVKIERRWVTYK